MTVPICFIDTETTGVHPGRRPWEIAIIRRESDGQEHEFVWHVQDVDLSNADPFGLKIGRFYERHRQFGGARFGGDGPPYLAPEVRLAVLVDEFTRGAHIVGVVPNFDTETLDPMLRRHHRLPGWHYHLIDVGALAVGYLRGIATTGGTGDRDWTLDTVDLPWKSDELSRACGVEPPSQEDRHTALGDALWAKRWYDAIVHGKRAAS